MPLTAVRHVRKMRGGAQAHLLEADDGKWYVVKFRNNPQHRRVLVNEALCATLLRYLKISAPETALIQVSAELPGGQPRMHIQLGTRRVEIEPGWQFGSQLSGRPGPHRRLRFSPRRPAVPGRQPGGLPRHPGLRQVGGQCRRPAVRLLSRHGAARRSAGGRAGFRRPHDRPRLRLQRPQLGLSGIGRAGALRPQAGLRRGALAGRFPAVAGPGGALSRRGHGPGLEEHPAGLDRRRGGCAGPAAGAVSSNGARACPR